MKNTAMITQEVINYSNGDKAIIGTMHYPLSNDGKWVDFIGNCMAVHTDAGFNTYIIPGGRVKYISGVKEGGYNWGKQEGVLHEENGGV